MKLSSLFIFSVVSLPLTMCANDTTPRAAVKNSPVLGDFLNDNGHKTLKTCADAAMNIVSSLRPQVPSVAVTLADEMLPINQTIIQLREGNSVYPTLEVSVSNISPITNEQRKFDGSSIAKVTFNLNSILQRSTNNIVRDRLANELTDNISGCIKNTEYRMQNKYAVGYFKEYPNTEMRYAVRFQPAQ